MQVLYIVCYAGVIYSVLCRCWEQKLAHDVDSGDTMAQTLSQITVLQRQNQGALP